MAEKPSSLQQEKESWAAGDLARVLATSVLVGELLCEAVVLHAGERVLDVATGSGNAAFAAARRRAKVVGVDFVPALLETARRRAMVDHLSVEFREGDAEHLPFEPRSFDVVLSTFGVMFAPDQAKAARELVRVTRPGGRLGLASWTPTGFIGRLFATVDRFAPLGGTAPPATRWGDETALRELFGPDVGITSTRRMANARSDSVESYVEFFRNNFGPAVRAYDALDADGQARLTSAIQTLVREHNRATDGTVFLPAEYLETVVTVGKRAAVTPRGSAGAP